MNSNDPVQLHDKSTRGAKLSAEERARLDEWYAQQDLEESALLAVPAESTTLAALRTQVHGAVSQLLTTAQRIQTLTSENDHLRREVAVLQEQLTHKAPAQSA